MQSSREKLRAVLIGTGSIARSHVQAVNSEGNRIELTAAMDVDRDRVQAFCEENSVPRFYTDIDELLLQEQPQLALIATPSATHCELGVASMDAGAWV